MSTQLSVFGIIMGIFFDFVLFLCGQTVAKTNKKLQQKILTKMLKYNARSFFFPFQLFLLFWSRPDFVMSSFVGLECVFFICYRNNQDENYHATSNSFHGSSIQMNNVMNEKEIADATSDIALLVGRTRF